MVIAIVIAWSCGFDAWSMSGTLRRSRSPLWTGFSLTAASALFLVTGLIGYNLSQHDRFVTGTWADGVILWQVVVGLVMLPVAIHFLRRGVRDINQKPSQPRESLESPRDAHPDRPASATRTRQSR
ncbi:MAG: hypothetical protein ACRD1V_01610 [Vicinamibacterales bacterium]